MPHQESFVRISVSVTICKARSPFTPSITTTTMHPYTCSIKVVVKSIEFGVKEEGQLEIYIHTYLDMLHHW